MPINRHNYLFPEAEPVAKGKLSDLPLDSGKTLEPINKTGLDVRNSKANSPSADKEFFSFFKLSSYPIPVGAQKASIELDENSEK